MYIKTVTVKTKEKIYRYIVVCDRVRRPFSRHTDEKVICRLGDYRTVKRSAYLLITGLQRLQDSDLSAEPGLKRPRKTTDKKKAAR